MIELLDYIEDYDDNFWIVNNITDNKYKGFIIYRVSDDGRYNNITKKYYIKDNDNNGIIDIPLKYKRIFKPKEFYLTNKDSLTGIWKEYINILNEIGINDIGIFGSYLIGFDIKKDVDFCIYGIENLYRYYNNINYIKKKLNVTSITDDHINYQYNKHKVKFNKECDLKEIIGRNWSGIELANGVLSTPRFISNVTSIPLKKGIDKKIRIEIIDGFYSTLLPRIAKVKYNNEIYTIYSTLWKMQSFAHKGDIMEIYGNIDYDKKIIIFDDNNYYIKYIYKSNIIN